MSSAGSGKSRYRVFRYKDYAIGRAKKSLERARSLFAVCYIIVESDDCRMPLEAEGNFISYVEVDLKATAPHSQNQEFDLEPILGALRIGLTELDLESKLITMLAMIIEENSRLVCFAFMMAHR